mgnify:CR=1 FL=1
MNENLQRKFGKYFEDLSNLFAAIEVSDKNGNALNLEDSFSTTVKMINSSNKNGSKVYFIGSKKVRTFNIPELGGISFDNI